MTAEHAHPSPKSRDLAERVLGRLALGFCAATLAFVGCGGAQKSSKDAHLTGTQQQCIDEANAKPKPSDNPPESVSISRILVRHADSSKPEGTTRSRGQACVRALEAREELRDGMDWEDTVKAYSDDHSKPDGDLGQVKKKDLDPKLARAAFALEPKELSYVVETEEGFQIVLRTK